MLNKRKIGAHYEDIAYRYLHNQGLRLIARNSQYRLGELDLIMKEEGCLVFVEVRYRKNAIYGNAQSTVTIAKQNKIVKAAYCWMALNQINSEEIEYRFDVFAITGQDYQWIKNAFSA